MIDHITIAVADVETSASFYARVLAPLGMQEVARDGGAVGFGTDAWRFGVAPSMSSSDAPPTLHIAFAAPDRTAVAAFHKAALAAGAACNGPPGERPEYGANYFAAFVFDPDGNNIEAVCRAG